VGDDPREPLAEDALGTEAVLAAEAARTKVKSDGDAVPREVGHLAVVIAVDS